MDAASITIGGVALTSLFNNAVDCFNYVQIGRNFGKNFTTSLLRLDVAQLRLSRWGKSIGLGNSMDDVQSLQQKALSAEDVGQAERLLGQIQELFAEAEVTSNGFKNRTPSGDRSLILHDPSTDLEPVPASLHSKMRELATSRQGQTGLRQKVKWALYEKRHLSELVDEVTSLVDSLVDLFPAAKVTQRELCDVEVTDMNMEQGLPLLKEAASEKDGYLDAAISKAMDGSLGRPYNVTFSGSHNSGFQLGHNTGTISGLHWGSGVGQDPQEKLSRQI